MAKNKKNQNEAIGLDVTLSKSEAFIEKNIKTIVIVLVAVLVVVIGFFLYRNHQQSRNEEAAAALYKSEQAFAAQKYEQALNGSGSAELGFLKVIDAYSGTKSANMAKAYAALCYYNLDKVDEAIAQLESFDMQDDETLSPTLMSALGHFYASKGDAKKGAETLVSAAKKADNDALSPGFLKDAARLYESLGEKDKAVSLYNEIKDKYYRSQLAQSGEIDKYLEKLN